MVYYWQIIINCWANNVIDGIWVFEITEWSTTSEIVFNNGVYEISWGDDPIRRGTYSINDNIVTLTVTSIHGIGFSFGDFEDKWYFRDEVEATFRSSADIRSLLSDEEISDAIVSMFSTETYYFSISGNFLTMDDITYTRVQ